MLFRIWYHACQVCLLGFYLVFAGIGGMFVFEWLGLLVPIGFVLLAPVCIFSVLLCPVWYFLGGINSACPLCGANSYWLMDRSLVLTECEECGLVGGAPLWNLVPEVIPPPSFDSSDVYSEDEE
jgi:hypothetical protein